MSWTPRSLRSPGTMTPYFTPRTSPKATPFEVKMVELERLKKEISRHMGHLNSVRIRYIEWFEKRRQSFVDAVKLVQITYPELVPKDVNTLKLFRLVYETARSLPKRGLPVERSAERMSEFLEFVDNMQELRVAHDSLYEKVCAYCDSITQLRDPHIKDNVDDFQKKLDEAFEEDFDCDNVHNEKDNLFTYKVAQQDHKFHGLLSYVPYLLKMATNMCYWSCQLYLEKE